MVRITVCGARRNGRRAGKGRCLLRPSVRLRANPKQHVGAGRAATDGFVDPVQKAVAQNRKSEPIGGDEVRRVLRIYTPTIRSGRAEYDLVADGQAQDVNRRRWRRLWGHRKDLAAEKMDGTDVGVVRSDGWNGVGNGTLANVVIHHSRTEDLKGVNRAGVHGKGIGPAANQSEGRVGLVPVDRIEEARGSDGKIRRGHGLGKQERNDRRCPGSEQTSSAQECGHFQKGSYRD